MATATRHGGQSRRVELLGASPAIREIREMIGRVGPTDLRILIQGESGTGKELVARAIHAASGRGPFVPVNCAAVPAALLEAEFFGHVRGAFTGADADRPGLLAQADGGTLFLDELGDLPLSLQVKLLRAVDEGEVRRLGSTRLDRVDVRLISATNRDLRAEMEARRFRKDLYWRLKDEVITLPPLRERPGDIGILASHFARGRGRILAPEAVAMLEAHRWPGNVRELRSAIARAAAFTTESEICAEDFSIGIRSNGDKDAVDGNRLRLEEVVRRHIMEVLDHHADGKPVEAARLLGIDRKTLRRKLVKYGQTLEEPQ